MAVHDRLKPPTLEAPPTRAFFGLPVALTLAILAAGFAYAMPRLQTVSAESDDSMVVVEAGPTGSTHTLTATPSPEPTEDADDANEDGADNHGKVVSTAAHCDIKGKAHGELVRSIAKDKEATVADAQAACDAALAAQDTATTETKSTGRGHGSKPPKPVKPAKTTHTETETSDTDSSDTDTEVSNGGGKPDHAGKPAKP